MVDSKKKIILHILLWLISTNLLSQRTTVKGIITDVDQMPLSFVSIYEKGTSNATLSNDEGQFELLLDKNATLVIQYLGYSTKEVQINTIKTPLQYSVVLEEEIFRLNTVEVKANREDPAYAIIRAAITKREEYYNIQQKYTADLYVKGVIKITDAPDKFMGQEIGTMEGIIDSNKQGIFYLSESSSTIMKDGKNRKEILHSSIVSGDNTSVGFNQFLNSNVDFYSKDINVSRKMVGPIDDDALTYYEYKLLNTRIDQGGNLVHRIAVIPKSEYRPCFFGEIYIIDGSYYIHSLDLKTTGNALKSNTLKRFRVTQVHAPVGALGWRLITQNITVKMGFFAFEGEGNFSSVFSDYNTEPVFEKNTFSSTVFEAEESAIKADTAFWNEKRPIALTKEEKKDYITKDSLQRIWTSKSYLDSIDKVNNEFKLLNLISGYTYENSFKKRRFSIAPPSLAANFNPIEGFNLSLEPSLEWESKNEKNAYRLSSQTGYGFVDNKLKPVIAFRHFYNPKKRARWQIEGGRTLADYSDFQIMAEISNSWHSLVFKNNYLRLYQKDFLQLKWVSDIGTALRARLSLNYEDRNIVQNNTNYSIRKKGDDYEYNNPLDVLPTDFNIDSKKVSMDLSLTWNPGQKSMNYPNRTIKLGSKYPTISLDIEYAPKLSDDFVGFSKVELGIRDNRLPMGRLGYLAYNIKGGTFIQKGGDFPDFFHFIGHEVIPRYISKYQSTYKLLPYYHLDSQEPYLSGFFQYHLDGLLGDKIPVLNKLGWKLVTSAATLIREDLQYIEPGVGIEGIKVGPLDIIRLDYYWGFDRTGYRNQGFKFGFVNFIE